MDIDLVNRWNIPIYPLKDPISASTLCVTHITDMLTFTVSGNHAERIQLLPNSPSAPVIWDTRGW